MEAEPHQNLDDDRSASEPEPIMDRRMTADRRKGDRRKGGAPARTPRNINQYDMSGDELEFVEAVIRYRERNGNRFPKARDILRILKDLGYEKQS